MVYREQQRALPSASVVTEDTSDRIWGMDMNRDGRTDLVAVSGGILLGSGRNPSAPAISRSSARPAGTSSPKNRRPHGIQAMASRCASTR